jgi:predicted peptidase
MRKTLIYLFGLLIITGTVSSCKKHMLPPIVEGPGTPHPDPVPVPKLEETKPPILTGISDSISDNILGYYQSMPARYNEGKEKYPVIIDFHGGGQYGDGNAELYKVLKMGIPKLISEEKFPPSFTVNNEKFSFIVIAPQLVKKIANVEILRLLNYVKAKYRVDTARIYLTGFSLGGRQAANYAAVRPTEFAAICTFGGLPQIDQDIQTKTQAMVDADLPIWHFHNKDDSAWAYSEAVEYIRILDSLNPSIPPKFTSFDIGEGKDHHDCWTRTTNPEYKEDGKNIYEWMLGYKR